MKKSMLKCPLCEKECQNYASNSHVIPRFILKETKENGQNMKFHKNWSKNQSDLVDNFICQSCEGLLAKIEKKSADTFNNINKENFNNLFIYDNIKITNTNDQNINLYKLIISILVRYDLYYFKKNNKSLLGNKHLKIMKKIILEDEIDLKRYPILMRKEKTKGVIFPHKIKCSIYHKYKFAGKGFYFEIFVASENVKKQSSFQNEYLIIYRDNHAI